MEIIMNKLDIFKNYSLNKGTVEVANWGGEVNIVELSAGAMAEMQTLTGKEIEMAAIAVIHGVTDVDGKKLFVKSDLSKLLDMSASDLVLISAAVMNLSDLGNTDK